MSIAVTGEHHVYLNDDKQYLFNMLYSTGRLPSDN